MRSITGRTSVGAIETEHRLLDLRRLPRREAHARVAGELLDDLGVRQRPVGAAAVHRLAMHQHAAVAQRDLHVAGVVAREGRARIDLVIDQIAHAQDRLVVERLGLQFGEREASANEARGDQIGDRELRVIGVRRAALVRHRLAHGLDHLGRDQRLDAHDVVDLELVLSRQNHRGVGAGMGEVARRQRLHGDRRRLPDAAEAGGRAAPALVFEAALQIRIEHAEAALIGAGRADEAFAAERGRRDAGLRRPSGMHALGPRAVLEEFHAARRHRQRDALRHRQRLRRKSHQRSGGERAAEHADHAGRVEADLMEVTAADRAEPRRRFHARDIGGDEIGAGLAAHERRGQHRRP